MRLAEAAVMALGTMRAHRVRTALTVAGTVMGVAFLITVVTVVEGMGHFVEHDFVGRIYGFHTIRLRQHAALSLDADPGAQRAGSRNPPLTFSDAAWLAERMRTEGTVAYTATGQAGVWVPRGAVLQGVRVVGASASQFRVQGLAVAGGRPFSPREDEHGVPVAVVGREVAARLFPRGGALGGTVVVEGIPFRVVGVLARQGSLFAFTMDRVVLVPARSPLNGRLFRRDVADVIAFQVRDPARLTAARTELEGWMRLRHGLLPLQPDDFVLSTSEGALRLWDRISAVMMVAGPALTGIALLVGMLVSANVMLVSVAERTREIGLRMSLGAQRRDILVQFLVEAGATSGAGGAVGLLLGLLLAGAISLFSPVPARVPLWTLALGPLLGVAVGLLAGAYPAYRASRLDPIVALGHE